MRCLDRLARTVADAVADEQIHAALFQVSCYRLVARVLYLHDLTFDRFEILNRVNLKFGSMSKMREHFAVFVRDSNFHGLSSIFGFAMSDLRQPCAAYLLLYFSAYHSLCIHSTRYPSKILSFCIFSLRIDPVFDTM